MMGVAHASMSCHEVTEGEMNSVPTIVQNCDFLIAFFN